MRLWRAFGDAAVMLLLVALAMGPAARLAPPLARLLPWRREFGVWFGLAALVHTLIVLDGWARWDVARFLGYTSTWRSSVGSHGSSRASASRTSSVWWPC